MMACRACASADLTTLFNLGIQPPANAYLASLDEPEVRYPLALAFCRACGLAQLRDPQPPALYRNYRYLTGASAAARQYWADYAEQAIAPRVAGGDLVIDIGGNDGTLLAQINPGIRRINVDPAANLAEMNETKGIEFVPQALDQDLAEDIVENYGPARVVCANNVLAHTDAPAALLRAIATLLGEEGTLIAEVHWAHHLITAGCWDQIYHEHACYYSLGSFIPMLLACGLQLDHAQVVPSQGQSLRLFCTVLKSIQDFYCDMPTAVARLLEQERAADLDREDIWQELATQAYATQIELVNLLTKLKHQGKRIVGYGAPAKGNTLLNFCHIGTSILDYLTDTTHMKQGLYAPGTRIPIVHPARLKQESPDYALLLAWNHREAILARSAP